jgi:hypothetical protein
MDSEDRSLSRVGAQRMIKLILKGWLQNWQRGRQSTSAADTAFKRHLRWQRSQSCFLEQMHASTNDASPDDSASKSQMRHTSFARGMRNYLCAKRNKAMKSLAAKSSFQSPDERLCRCDFEMDIKSATKVLLTWQSNYNNKKGLHRLISSRTLHSSIY